MFPLWRKEGQGFIGKFENGQKNGYGLCHFHKENLLWYKGEWKDNQPHGLGEGHYKPEILKPFCCSSSTSSCDDKIYIGQWRNGVPEGLGTIYYPVGKQATVFHKEGVIKEVLAGHLRSRLRQTWDIRKWQIVLCLSAIMFLLIALIASLSIVFRPPTCTEALLNQWDDAATFIAVFGMLRF